MLRKWLDTHSTADFDLTSRLFPPASDREFWDGKYDVCYVREAEKYLGYEWPLIRATQYMELVRSGNRRAQENPHFERRMVLCILLLGEIAEHRGRFIPDIIDGVFAICEETFWGVSAHVGGVPSVTTKNNIDLFAAETGALISMICYMLRDELTEACPNLIPIAEEELHRRIIDQYTERTDYAWMGYDYPVNNWTPWIISNLLTVHLLTVKDKESLSRAVDKMMYEINKIYTTIPDDGGCDEGACYWAVSGGCLFEFCDQLYVASGGAIDFFSDEKLHRICSFEHKVYLGGGYFTNFADGTPKITHSITGLFYAMRLRFNDPLFGILARDIMKNNPEKADITPGAERDAKVKRRLYEMIYKKDIENEGDITFSETEFFARTEISLLRRGEWTVAAKGGHNNENHNHNDVGSFIAYCDSIPVLVDPSCGTYTAATFTGSRYDIWTNNSAWHNLPVINGHLQKEGAEYRADGFTLDGGCVSISFAGAYPEAAGAVSVCRDIFADDSGVRVSDIISLADAGTVTENFITPHSVEIRDGRAVIGGRFILECTSPARLTTDSVSFDGDERLTLYWMGECMNRISFTFDGEKAEANFILRRIG